MGLERGVVFCPFVFYFINSFDPPGFKSLPFGQTQALEEFGIESVAGLSVEVNDRAAKFDISMFVEEVALPAFK